MSHFMDFYLTEIKTQVVYTPDWLITGKNIYKTYLHIDNSSNAVIVNSKDNMPNNTTFKMFMRRMKPDTHTIYAFEFTDSGNSMGVTGKGSNFSMTLFGAVESVFETMVEALPNSSIIMFASETNSSRNKIYERFYKKILSKYPFPITYDDMLNNNFPLQTDFELYCFAKQTRTIKILRGDDIITNFKNKFKNRKT